MNMEISRLNAGELSDLAPLFSGYREFYDRDVRPTAERKYLEERLENDECVVFMARDGGQAAGFVLLYPTFDSVGLQSVWVLHDLYVSPGHRRKQIARQLMHTAHEHCRSMGAGRVDLATAVTNTVAQPLYESLGYERDDEFYYYSLNL